MQSSRSYRTVTLMRFSGNISYQARRRNSATLSADDVGPSVESDVVMLSSWLSFELEVVLNVEPLEGALVFVGPERKCDSDFVSRTSVSPLFGVHTLVV